MGTFKTQKVSCASDPDGLQDPMDLTTTGGTIFRYDETSGQYMQNWQTPKYDASGQNCYRATSTAQDGSVLAAYFMLKK